MKAPRTSLLVACLGLGTTLAFGGGQAQAAGAVGVAGAPAAAASPGLSAFVTPDGALRIRSRGHASLLGQPEIDPYFATQALIIERRAGNRQADALVVGWLRWLLPRQGADGRIARFCGADGAWRACAPADADDAMAASLIELLARSRDLLPAAMHASADVADRRAHALLRQLRRPDGLYRAHAGEGPAYLMDNAEVHSALLAAGQRQEAAALQRAMEHTFHHGPGLWSPADPAYADGPAFYPHAVAPTYRWREGLIDAPALQAEAAAWLALYGRAWLERTADPYPWGIVAWAMHTTVPRAAGCWRLRARAVWPTAYWTVLDQAVEDALALQGIVPAVAPELCPATGRGEGA